MIIGLGVDLVENNRIERDLARCEWLREDGVFSSEEIWCCRQGSHPARRYAACFAAKEATLKALGIEVGETDWRHGRAGVLSRYWRRDRIRQWARLRCARKAL